MSDPPAPPNWMFFDEHGWVPYDAAVARQLEDEFQTLTTGIVRMVAPSGISYLVDVRHMMQTNGDTGNIRKVRRVAGGAAPAASQDGPAGVWEFEDGAVWKPYDAKSTALLNDAKRTGAVTVALHANRQSYTVDLVRMMQRNDRTGVERRVRCRPGAVAGAGTTVAQSAVAAAGGGGGSGGVVSGTSPSGQVVSAGVWEFEDGAVWKPYDAKSTVLLNDAKRTGAASVSLRANRQSYTVDLVRMMQRNDRTGVERRVRCRPGGAVAGAGTPVAQSAVAAAGGGGGGGLLSQLVAVFGGGSGGSGGSSGASTESETRQEVIQLTSDGGSSELTLANLAELTGWTVLEKSDPSIAGEECSVCMDDLTDDSNPDMVVRLRECTGHCFHASCIHSALQRSTQCPMCKYSYLPLQGNQPDGSMTIRYEPRGRLPCKGFESFGTIVITYHFPSGIQGPKHERPGTPYAGTSREAFLPDTPEGREILALFKRCFQARLTFNIGRSVTTGRENCVVWHGVHHKTSTSGGPSRFGYPDETYFERVRGELASKGIM